MKHSRSSIQSFIGAPVHHVCHRRPQAGQRDGQRDEPRDAAPVAQDALRAAGLRRDDAAADGGRSDADDANAEEAEPDAMCPQ